MQRRRDSVKVDLPEPVRPTRAFPSVSHFDTVKTLAPRYLTDSYSLASLNVEGNVVEYFRAILFGQIAISVSCL